MREMIKYEIKKVFSKNSSKIAMIILLFTLIITCYLATNIYYVNEYGAKEYGHRAVQKLRYEKKQWKGILDEQMIQDVIVENIRISNTVEAKSKDHKQNDIAYAWKQGFDDIRNLLNNSFANRFREYDYYKADSLNIEDANNFYENRILLLKDWLNEEGKDQFSEMEKDYIIGKYQSLRTPMLYDYSDGWRQLFEYSTTIIMIMVLVIGYMVAGIFSNEFIWKSDSIFFSTYKGRDKAIESKIKAGILITTAIYWIVIIIYSGFVLFYLGIEGANIPIQSHFSGWKTFYNITVWQEYLLIIMGGYIGSLVFSLIAMFVSARWKSSMIAVTVPFILIFLPSFLENMNNNTISKAISILPDRLLQISNQIRYFDLFTIGNKVISGITMLFSVYTILSIILVPYIYFIYKKNEIE